jgi:hypothetical protein
VRRFRIWFWTRTFLLAQRLQNSAALRRSDACGCVQCQDFADMLRAVTRVREQLRGRAFAMESCDHRPTQGLN